MSIINAIISAIMSFFMLLFPWMGPADPVDPVEPVNPAVQVIRVMELQNEVKDTMKKGVPIVISDYAQWKAYAPLQGNETVATYDEAYFKTGSVVVVEVSLPDTSYGLEVEATKEVDNTLKVELESVKDLNSFAAMVLCEYVVVIPVSKNITSADVSLEVITTNSAA